MSINFDIRDICKGQKLSRSHEETMHASKTNIMQEQKKKVTVLPLNQLGTSIAPGKFKIVPQTQLQSPVQWTVSNTKNILVRPGQILIENRVVPTTAQQTEQSTIYIQDLKTYQESSKSLKNKQEKSLRVLPKIAIHRDKLVKVEPLIEESVISDNNASSTNISICTDFNSSTTESVHTHNKSFVKNEYVPKTPKITINKKKLIKIGSVTDVYDQVTNSNKFIVQNEVANIRMAIRTQILKMKLLDLPLINDLKFEEPAEVPNQQIRPTKSNIQILETKSTTKELETSQYSINKEEIAKTEQESTELYDFCYDNNVDCGDEVEAIQDIKHVQDDVKEETNEIENGDIKYGSNDNELAAEQSADITESGEMEIDQTNVVIENGVDNGLKKLIVVSADTKFTLLLRAVPDDEKDALIERLKAQNIEIPKYSTNDYKKEDKNKACCHFCHRAFASSKHLEMHMKRHKADGSWITELTVPCKYENCSRMFTTEFKAEFHYTHVHERGSSSQTSVQLNMTPKERNIPCRFKGCNRMFTNEKYADRHYRIIHLDMKSDVNDKSKFNFECNVCGNKYSSSAILHCHMRKHTGERPYVCPHCPKAYTSSTQLKIHYQTHTDERPFKCASCPKAFRQKGALNRHNRVHTGVKPYTCPHCNKSFSQSNAMKLHIRIIHLKLPTPYPSKKYQKTV